VIFGNTNHDVGPVVGHIWFSAHLQPNVPDDGFTVQKRRPISVWKAIPKKLIFVGETPRRVAHSLDTSEATKTGPTPAAKAPIPTTKTEDDG
jgi:hypothetical protein